MKNNNFYMKNAVYYIIYVLIINCVAYLFAFLIISWGKLFFGVLEETGRIWSIGLSEILSTTATVALFLKKDFAKVSDWCLRGKNKYGLLAISFALSCTLFVLISLLDELFPFTNSIGLTHHAINDMMASTLGIIGICLSGPLAEEIVFRGAVLRSLLEWTDKTWLAILISAALFSLIHMTLSQAIPIFIYGMLFGWLYVRTKSILPSTIIHIANNTFATLFYIAYGENIKLWQLLPNKTTGALLLSFTFISSMILIYAFAIKTRRSRKL